MDSALRPPPPFCFENNLTSVTSGNLNRQLTKWKKSFEIYAKACELNKKDHDVQVNILLHVIGEQCREVYEQFTGPFLTIDALLERFEKFFLPTKNLTIERHKFFTRSQMEGESVEQYTFELNKLAKTCEFSNLNDDLVRDRLICGIKEDALRERLLREKDLTLQKALDISRIAEMSRMQASHIKQETEVERHVHQVTEQQQGRDDGGMGDVHFVRRAAMTSQRSQRDSSDACRCGAGRFPSAVQSRPGAREVGPAPIATTPRNYSQQNLIIRPTHLSYQSYHSATGSSIPYIQA